MSSGPLSRDGAWYWDGQRWLPGGIAPVPLPPFLGRRGGSHWDGRELLARCSRGPFVACVMVWPVVIGLQVSSLVLGLRASADLNGGVAPFTDWPLLILVVCIAVLAGCWVYYLSCAIRPPALRFSARGVVARQPWRGAFYVPWDAVVQIGVYRGMRTQLVVEVSDDFWRYLGRRWTPRWAAWAGPPRGASMIMVPPRRTGMEMTDILRCLRQVAPSAVPVTYGLVRPE